jgi:hypothetical protein
MNNRTTLYAAALVTAAFALGFLMGRWGRTTPPPRVGAYEVARRLCARGLCLRVVPASAGDHEAAAFLTRTDRTWYELSCLPRSAAAGDRWQGTVLCWEVPPKVDLAERDPQRLLRCGNFIFYGDPELLRQVAMVLHR